MKRGFIEYSDSEEEETREDWKRRATAMIKKTGIPAPNPDGTPADSNLEVREKVLSEYLAKQDCVKVLEEEDEAIHVEFYGIDDEIAWISYATGHLFTVRELKEGK